MAKEYIDREAFIAAKRAWYCDNCDKRKGMKNGKMRFVYDIGDAPCRSCGVDDMMCDIEDFPAADVVEVRHGRWTKELLFCKPVCSECGEPCIGLHGYDYELTNYCPNCGAKMDGDGE